MQPTIAITDSVFPSLDPAKKALARHDPEYRMAKSASTEDILAVARDADAIHVTYAKLPGELLRRSRAARRLAVSGWRRQYHFTWQPKSAASPSITCRITSRCCVDHAMALFLAPARKVTAFSNKLSNPAAGSCRRSCRCGASKARCWGSVTSAIFRGRWR